MMMAVFTYYEMKIAKVVARKLAALESFFRNEPRIEHASVSTPFISAVQVPMAGEVYLDWTQV